MGDYMDVIIGLIIPFIGTSLGASLVYFMNNNLNSKSEAILLSISSGVMIAAAIWSLLLPSLEIGLIPTLIGFIIGIIFLGSIKQDADKVSKMTFAVTLHNIPEGMAVAVSYLSYMMGSTGISYVSCLVLSIGIAIQNFPEGAIISMPLRSNGLNKHKAFFYGVSSGIVEPLFGIITILLSGIVVSLLPYFLGFAAGAMIYVVVKELIPDSSKYKYSVYFFSFGFLIMMILDVIFS